MATGETEELQANGSLNCMLKFTDYWASRYESV